MNNNSNIVNFQNKWEEEPAPEWVKVYIFYNEDQISDFLLEVLNTTSKRGIAIEADEDFDQLFVEVHFKLYDASLKQHKMAENIFQYLQNIYYDIIGFYEQQ